MKRKNTAVSSFGNALGANRLGKCSCLLICSRGALLGWRGLGKQLKLQHSSHYQVNSICSQRRELGGRNSKCLLGFAGILTSWQSGWAWQSRADKLWWCEAEPDRSIQSGPTTSPRPGLLQSSCLAGSAVGSAEPVRLFPLHLLLLGHL